MRLDRLLTLSLFMLVAACATRPAPLPVQAPVPASGALRIASWNMEFLAARNGDGCHPRRDADYQRMRDIANSVDADVIAFQEVENEAAAARVFDPARYAIVMETRQGTLRGSCGGQQSGQRLIRQAVGFAIRRGLTFDRAPDLAALSLGDPNLRSGVDVTIRPEGGRPIRLLAVHLKSGCFSGRGVPACETSLRQIPVIESWIDDAARGPTRFAVLGDWNRRLALPGDLFWHEIDDGDPPDADLRLADEGVRPHCDPRYDAFIDHVVLDARAGADLQGFREITFGPGPRPSDHCPVEVDVAR